MKNRADAPIFHTAVCAEPKQPLSQPGNCIRSFPARASHKELGMEGKMDYPFDSAEFMKNRKKLSRALREKAASGGNPGMVKKIAVLGGYTTHDIVRSMEVFLLDSGIDPVFYESEYAKFYEDAVFGNPELDSFAPDLVYICTSVRNIRTFPSPGMDEEKVDELLEENYRRFEACWKAVAGRYHCPVIQNNFEYPSYRLLGNLDAYDIHGRVRFVNELNRRFAQAAQKEEALYLVDVNYISSCFGLDRWSDEAAWNMYKYAVSMDAVPSLSWNTANVIRAITGKSKKALALDLDNTLWGGVVGDDGVEGLEIGEETAQGETFLAFQRYVKELSGVGVILTVDSKNDYDNAVAGLNHPSGIIRPEDFADIEANWEPKSINLVNTAKKISILPEAFVFADDNPAERAIIRDQVPGAAVPELGSPETFIRTIDRAGYFEPARLTADDVKRAGMYRANAERSALEASFSDYGQYLDSLEMHAHIAGFAPVDYARITQLTNKSNQFNLTTKRYTLTEIEEAAQDRDTVTLCGRLSDRFGDNGIVSLIIASVAMTVSEDKDGRHEATGELALLVDLWLMSCRVLKRDMEYAMMDALAEAAVSRGIRSIYGYYFPTAKNGMVRNFYRDMGFTLLDESPDGKSAWRFVIPDNYTKKNTHIAVI